MEHGDSLLAAGVLQPQQRSPGGRQPLDSGLRTPGRCPRELVAADPPHGMCAQTRDAGAGAEARWGSLGENISGFLFSFPFMFVINSLSYN